MPRDCAASLVRVTRHIVPEAGTPWFQGVATVRFSHANLD